MIEIYEVNIYTRLYKAEFNLILSAKLLNYSKIISGQNMFYNINTKNKHNTLIIK